MIENLAKNKIDKLLTEIFVGETLKRKKLENLAGILDKSCQAGIARAKELAKE
jgi:hypothetical protein